MTSIPITVSENGPQPIPVRGLPMVPYTLEWQFKGTVLVLEGPDYYVVWCCGEPQFWDCELPPSGVPT